MQHSELVLLGVGGGGVVGCGGSTYNCAAAKLIVPADSNGEKTVHKMKFMGFLFSVVPRDCVGRSYSAFYFGSLNIIPLGETSLQLERKMRSALTPSD